MALSDFVRDHGAEYEIADGVTLADTKRIDVTTSRASETVVELHMLLSIDLSRVGVPGEAMVPIVAELVLSCDFDGPAVSLHNTRLESGTDVEGINWEMITHAANEMLEDKTKDIVETIWNNMADFAATADAHQVCPTGSVSDRGDIHLEIDFVLGCVNTDTKVTPCARGFRGAGSLSVCRNGLWKFVSRDCESAQ